LLLYPRELNEKDDEEAIERDFTLMDGTEVFVRTISLNYDLKREWSKFVEEFKDVLGCLKLET